MCKEEVGGDADSPHAPPPVTEFTAHGVSETVGGFGLCTPSRGSKMPVLGPERAPPLRNEPSC